MKERLLGHHLKLMGVIWDEDTQAAGVEEDVDVEELRSQEGVQ